MSDVYQDFVSFMEQAVIPLHEAHPDAKWVEPDETEDRRGVFGRFSYAGKIWTVHKDTRFEVAMLAYRELTRAGGRDPFIQEPARRGVGLNIRPDLRADYVHRFKHFYVYAR